MRLAFAFVILNFYFLTAIGQDSLFIETRLGIEARSNHILSREIGNTRCIDCLFRSIADSPMYHYAVYTGVKYDLRLNKKYTLETALYAEERSYSGGNNTLSNIILFPKIKLSGRDTLSIKGQNFPFEITGGDFWDEDVNDMLRFYNLDYQALDMSIGNAWKLRAFVIVDLASNIGYDLHELYTLSLDRIHPKFFNRLSLTSNQLVHWDQATHPSATDWNVSNFIAFKPNSRLSAKAQVELRINENTGQHLAAGAEILYKLKNLKMTLAVRYYQDGFNQGYASSRPQYATEDAYIGRQLYPLKNFYRPYGQWANFTSFQRSDVLGTSFRLEWERHISGRYFAFVDFDFNLIGKLDGSRSGTTLPFYQSGIKIKFLDCLVGNISVTNKHMNLFSFYQTFDASKKAFVSYGVHLNIEKLQAGKKRIAL